MAENFVRVVINQDDEQQLTEFLAEPTDDGEYIEWAGTINGSPVPVRFYRASEDD